MYKSWGGSSKGKRANTWTEAVSLMNGWGEGERQGVVAGLYPSVNCLHCPTALYCRCWETSPGNSCGTGDNKNVNKKNFAAASHSSFERGSGSPYGQSCDFPGRQTLSHEVKLSRDEKVNTPQSYHWLCGFGVFNLTSGAITGSLQP